MPRRPRPLKERLIDEELVVEVPSSLPPSAPSLPPPPSPAARSFSRVCNQAFEVATSPSMISLSPTSPSTTTATTANVEHYPEERNKLEQLIQKFQLGYANELPEEKALRISVQDDVDRVVFVGFAIFILISVISCAVTMWMFTSSIFKLLFVLSILQGPFALYQRLQLIALKSKREAIATLWNNSELLKYSNDGITSNIVTMEKDIERLGANMNRYNDDLKGYKISEFKDLYDENRQINETKKLLAEAIGIQKLTRSILQTDVDKDHYIGDAELSLLSHRIESVEGVPFTSADVCEQFRREEEKDRTLRRLAEVVQHLYIEKRRMVNVARANEEEMMMERSPRNLGSSLLWRRKLDEISIAVC